MKEFDYDAYFNLVGNLDGYVVDVASDMFSFLMYCREKHLHFDMNCLVDSLVNHVGNNGTVLIRAFNWSFCKGIPFDIRTTPSKVGILGNTVLKNNKFRRTRHPLYSWFVFGKLKDLLTEIDEISAFGQESIFGFLYKTRAKMLTLGNISERISVFSNFHYAEQMAQVPYRYHKYFDGYYTNYNGYKTLSRYTMFVRRLDIPNHYNVSFFESNFCEQGIGRSYLFDNCLKIGLTDISSGVDILLDDLENNFGIKSVLVNGKPGFKGLSRPVTKYENEV